MSERATFGTHIEFTQTRSLRTDSNVLAQRRILNAGTHPKIVDAYRMLRTQVLQRMVPRGWNSLAIASCHAGDGRTTTAVNLAIAIANDPQHSALVVDLDLRTAGVAKAFGIDVRPDIVDYLFGDAEVVEALVHPDVERLTFLPARELASAADALRSKRAETLFAELRGRYRDRIVIYDLPPLLTCAEGLSVLPAVDAVLVVVRDGMTRRDDLLRLLEMIGDKPILGTVLNATLAQRVVERDIAQQ